MAGFIVYLLATGGIDRTGSVPDGYELMQAGDGEGVLLNDDPSVTGESYWVALGPPATLVQKPAMPVTIDKVYIAANGTQQAVISGVPAGSTLTVDGTTSWDIADGTAEFSAIAVKTYELKLTHYRYLPATFNVGVGKAEFVPATETEYGVSNAWPFPVAVETEAAVDANQTRTAQMLVATETETAIDAVAAMLVRADVAVEIEFAVMPVVELPAGTEQETGVDAVMSQNVDVGIATETETALDAAA